PYFDIFVESASYCLAVDHNQFDAIICLEAVKETIDEKMDMIDELINDMLDEELKILYLSCRIVSMLCLLTTFVVYSILPELRNIHTLVGYFCLLSSFFWLSAMSFDVWWTF
ncbi:hypothetical protein EAG_07208, partial [Camponotus floridanus]